MSVVDVEGVPSPAEDAAPESKSFFAELPGLLLVALAVALVIKTFIVQPFYIPSGSMIPTLEVNDRVMVSKLNYVFGEIERGDLLVFENPYAPDEEVSIPDQVVTAVLEGLGIRTSEYDDLIKRVIGLGGETLEVRDSTVFIDGREAVEPYLAPGSSMPDFGPVEIPEGEIFMMGDNRNQSSDSRVFGPVPEDEVIGQAILRIWPLDRIGLFPG